MRIKGETDFDMKVKIIILCSTILLITLIILFGFGINHILGPKIEEPVFVKSLIYSEDMDIDLYYIAPRDFDKSIEKIKIADAPKGFDCVLYDEMKDFEGKYKIVTAEIGVNYDDWNEETGIGDDLKITKVMVTWDDGTETLEDVGIITIMGGTSECNNYMSMKGHDGIRSATYTLTENTEIIGLDIPYKDENSDRISNITINDVPLDTVSRENPIVLKKNETCTIAYHIKTDSKTKYGDVCIIGSLIGKNNDSQEKIANFMISTCGFNGSIRKYLKNNV